MPYHFGKSIHKAIKERGMTVAEFARRIEMSRENAYDIFKRKDIDTELIRTISHVLNHDFLGESLALTKSNQKSELQSDALTNKVRELESELVKLHDRVLSLEHIVKQAKSKGK